MIDLAKVEKISVAGALVLAAEIDRWRRVDGRPMRPRNLRQWNSEVRGLLQSLGFFKLLDVPPSSLTGLKADENHGAITVLPMVSDTALDQKLLASLSAIADFLHGDPTVYAALVEAAYNVKKHAYPEDHVWRFLPVVKGWWATASFDPVRRCVKFIVYDQGVGIAETLPRWEGWEKVRGILAHVPAVGDAFSDEAHMIKAALEIDRTSLAGGHGKGLQDVVEVVRGFARSEVRILSGRGNLIYKSNSAHQLKDETLHLGGTLIEWTIPVQLSQAS